MKLTDSQLIDISGGSITASLLNSISRGVKTIFDLGRTVGSSIRRIKAGNFCKL